MKVDVIVLGAGAAGLMCAATAGKRGRSVLVLDHANKPGKKILMSGGGRCNFTNMDVTPDNYLSDNAHFCKSALSRYTQWHFIELVTQHGIAYHDKGEGQLFCDNKASDILNCLLKECEAAGVTAQTHTEIERVEKNAQGFTVETKRGDYQCESVVVATGGLSIPTMGATGFGYTLAEQFGLKVKPRTASLVPFTLSGHWQDLTAPLSGVSLRACVSSDRKSFTDELLFTHRGLSGPVILQISNYWALGEKITIDFLPAENLTELMAGWRKNNGKQELKNLLATKIPKRFVQMWLDATHNARDPIKSKTIAEYTTADIERLTEYFHRWDVKPSGTEGYRTAEVTLGGIDTDEISSKTFEAKNIQGLYFIGEVLDVTGWLGGFNFQWAWASGWCAGEVA
ncbi:BaiN/RdsA family NAD(P)/FAD-dependent oxidoreductase [Teredinibacter purpureus]|uniref:NAD(P)/FAD-dependent oxidoreductase n=1 Tax=Teredinibacter purpureus TaxID=2731756 RepID=UPI0005F83DF5|nr:NAD(P)/FAD-dependent oxidoreductase [Teredinibacter purpureus]